MRLQVRGDQHLMHRAGRQLEIRGQRAHAPAAVMLGLLADPSLHFLQDLRGMLGRPSGTRRILQPLQAFGCETPAPLADRDFRNAQRGGDLLIGLARCGGQDNPTAQGQSLRCRPHQVVQRCLHDRVEFDSGRRSGHVSNLPELADSIKHYLDDVLGRSIYRKPSAVHRKRGSSTATLSSELVGSKYAPRSNTDEIGTHPYRGARFYERLDFVFIRLATHLTAQKDGVTNDLSFHALISVVMEHLSDAVLLLQPCQCRDVKSVNHFLYTVYLTHTLGG